MIARGTANPGIEHLLQEGGHENWIDFLRRLALI